jgi:hypothetical protein
MFVTEKRRKRRKTCFLAKKTWRKACELNILFIFVAL